MRYGTKNEDGASVAIKYEIGELSPAELRREIADIWNDAQRSGKLLTEGHGRTLDEVEVSNSVRVRQSQMGLDYEPLHIIVEIFSPLGAAIIVSFWDTYLLARLRSRRGIDALGKEVDRQAEKPSEDEQDD